MRRKLHSILFFCAFILSLNAQDDSFTGDWKGYISIEGRADTFQYEFAIEQDKTSFSGLSFCYTLDSSAFARFNLTGVIIGDSLIFQEIQQYEPLGDKWCHKYMVLTKSRIGNKENLSGYWRATNCAGGKVFLSRNLVQERPEDVQEEAPFNMEGKWIGTLQQEDRNTLFRFEVDLTKNKKGVSYIIGGEKAGSARMELIWNWGLVNNSFKIVESKVIDKSNPDWPWCIKTADLKLRKDGDKFILEGPWQGFIQGFTPETGPCASGSLYLEKVPPSALRDLAPKSPAKAEPPQEKDLPRKIKVQKIVEVHSKNLRLRAWDSGTVDGDIITIFLNGEQILFRHRVSKRKYAFPITLQEDHNFMVMYADDIGDITPNTVAVSIDDGIKEQIIVLSSDLEESGAVLLKKIEIK